MDATVRLLADLVAIDSVNPSLVPGGAGERDIAARIAGELRAAGLDVEVTEAAAGRPNVVGRLQGKSPGRSLMLCGHMDTVGVAGMRAPFDPVIRDGRLYGRGAQDMKGGLAALIGAASLLAARGGLAAGTLILAAVADEEYASIGADALVSRWKADAAIVAEPTDLVIATGHKGFCWIEVSAEGVAAHGSRPREGRDAILRMGRILGRLEQLDRRLQAGRLHPILGPASLHASLIGGGRELSTYPEKCVLQMERRTLIGEDPEAPAREIESILRDLKSEDEEFRASARVTFQRPPYELPEGHFLLPALKRAVEMTGNTAGTGGVSFWTDAAILGQAGIPSVIFGPGGAGLHSAEEYVKLNEVLACRDAVAELARTVCGGNA
jgi:acetylornithine deacetylase